MNSKIILLVLPLFVIAISIAYYFAIFLPKKVSFEQEQILKTQERGQIESCTKAGISYHEDKVKTNPQLTYLIPKYGFDKEVNACIYAGGFTENKYFERHIINLDTNQEIAAFRQLDGKPAFEGYCDTCLEIEAFNAKEQELFPKD